MRSTGAPLETGKVRRPLSGYIGEVGAVVMIERGVGGTEGCVWRVSARRAEGVYRLRRLGTNSVQVEIYRTYNTSTTDVYYIINTYIHLHA